MVNNFIIFKKILDVVLMLLLNLCIWSTVYFNIFFNPENDQLGLGMLLSSWAIIYSSISLIFLLISFLFNKSLKRKSIVLGLVIAAFAFPFLIFNLVALPEFHYSLAYYLFDILGFPEDYGIVDNLLLLIVGGGFFIYSYYIAKKIKSVKALCQ